MDWCEVCGWRVVVSGCHVQLLRARPHVHILPNRSTGATIQKVPLVEKVSQKASFLHEQSAFISNQPRTLESNFYLLFVIASLPTCYILTFTIAGT